MRQKTRPFLSLLLVLAFCAQANAWLLPCSSCHAAGMDICTCHVPASSSHACSTQPAPPPQLTHACCCEIATSSEPNRENAVLFVVEITANDPLHFLAHQAPLTLPSLQPIISAQSPLSNRSTPPAPPLFILHSSYLI